MASYLKALKSHTSVCVLCSVEVSYDVFELLYPRYITVPLLRSSTVFIILLSLVRIEEVHGTLVILEAVC